MSESVKYTMKGRAAIAEKRRLVNELERAIVACVFRYVDRMNDHCESDKAANIVDEFMAEINPMMDQLIEERRRSP